MFLTKASILKFQFIENGYANDIQYTENWVFQDFVVQITSMEIQRNYEILKLWKTWSFKRIQISKNAQLLQKVHSQMIKKYPTLKFLEVLGKCTLKISPNYRSS